VSRSWKELLQGTYLRYEKEAASALVVAGAVVFLACCWLWEAKWEQDRCISALKASQDGAVILAVCR
jgi:hypothetical protein